MEHLRLIGIALGVLGLLATWVGRYRFRWLRRTDWLLGTLAFGALFVLGVWPDALNTLLRLFSFEKGGGGRLLGLLIFSNMLLFLLTYMALARGTKAERLVDKLVRELAKKEFRRSTSRTAVPIYIVIPAYNEAENIADVLAEMPDEVLGLATRAIVVVDGATDDTEQVVRESKHDAVSCSINRGGGSALKAGYELAIEDGAQIVVTLDADGQHVPEEIPRLVEPIVEGRADFVNGSRVLGSYEKDNEIRALGVVLFNWLISALTLTRITDCSNGFRAVRVSELAKLDLRQFQFHASEMLIEAIRQGSRVLEVPVTIRRRRSGESKKPPTLRYAWGFTRAILSTWLR